MLCTKVRSASCISSHYYVRYLVAYVRCERHRRMAASEVCVIFEFSGRRRASEEILPAANIRRRYSPGFDCDGISIILRRASLTEIALLACACQSRGEVEHTLDCVRPFQADAGNHTRLRCTRDLINTPRCTFIYIRSDARVQTRHDKAEQIFITFIAANASKQTALNVSVSRCR